jgi:PKD repeat protein
MGSYNNIISYWGNGTFRYAIFDNRIIASGFYSIRRTDENLTYWSDFIYFSDPYQPNIIVFQNELYLSNIYGDSRLWKVNSSFTDIDLICSDYPGTLIDIKASSNRLYAALTEGYIIRLNDTKDNWQLVYTFSSGEYPTSLAVLNDELYIGTNNGNLYKLNSTEDDIELICPTYSGLSNVLKLFVCYNTIYGIIYYNDRVFKANINTNTWEFIVYAPQEVNIMRELYGIIYIGCNYGILCSLDGYTISQVCYLSQHIWDMIVFNNKLYLSEGYFIGSLGIYNSAGNTDFYASTYSGYVPLIVSFYISNENSDFPIINYTWNFGDGNYSNEREPTHTYTSKGFFTVSITVDNGYDTFTTTYTDLIYALDYYRITYNGNGNTGGVAPIDPNGYLSGDITTILGPGTLTKEYSVFSHWNTDPDNMGFSINPGDIVYVYNDWILYAIWKINRIGGLIGDSYDENKIYDSYWDIETSEQNNSSGGIGKNTTEMKIQSTFVSWDFNNVWRIIENETYPQFLIADFTVDRTTGNAPLEVNFTNLCSIWPDENAVFIERLWDFGDGHTSTDLNPTHLYENVGNYTVTLWEKRNYLEVTRVKTNYINVTGFLVDFIGKPRIGYTFLTVQFTDLSIGTFDSWLWDFGDGRISTQRNPIHFYKRPGKYTVILKVSGPDGIFTKMKENYIIVNSKITYDIAPEPDKEAYLWGIGLIDNKKDKGIEIKKVFI